LRVLTQMAVTSPNVRWKKCRLTSVTGMTAVGGQDQNGISTAPRSAALVLPGSSISGRHIWKPAALRKGCVNAEKSYCCRQKLCILFQHSFNVQHRPTLV